MRVIMENCVQKYKVGLFVSLFMTTLLTGCASHRACCGANQDYYMQESPTFITASNGGKYFPYGNTSTEEGEAYYYDRSTYYRKGITYYSDGNAYR